MLLFLVEYVIPSLSLVAVGAYAEYRLGAKVASRVTSLEARLAAYEGRVAGVVESAKKAV